MADLYGAKESNIRKTWFLMTGFFLLVIALGWLFSYALDSPIILVIAVVVSVLMSAGSYWYSDKLVLKTTRAYPAEKRDYPELYRTVENLCITVGLPMPRIYVLPEEQPNAFATGRDENHSIVAVTEGLLNRLERSELEGVLAHELSHIKNKDMLLQTAVVVLAGVVALLSHFFLRISFFAGGSKRDKGGAILLLLGILAAILAPLAASLIKLSISRKREFLADSSGVLITRYPEGLARALEKISSDPRLLKKASGANAHLFIANPFRGKEGRSWFNKLFMTHPPVEDRIKALREKKVDN